MGQCQPRDCFVRWELKAFIGALVGGIVGAQVPKVKTAVRRAGNEHPLPRVEAEGGEVDALLNIYLNQ